MPVTRKIWLRAFCIVRTGSPANETHQCVTIYNKVKSRKSFLSNLWYDYFLINQYVLYQNVVDLNKLYYLCNVEGRFDNIVVVSGFRREHPITYS